MKNQIFRILALMLIVTSSIFVACSSDPEEVPEVKNYSVEITLVSTGAVSADILIKSENIAEVAWIASDVRVDQNVIYNAGHKIKITSNEQSETINGFTPNSASKAYFIAITDENKFFGDVIELEFETGDFTDEYTLFDIDYRSAKIHVKFPEQVRERGNVLKWGFADIGLYNNGRSDDQKLNMHEAYYKNYFTEDKLFVLDNEPENMYPVQDDGSIDPSYPYYEAIYPGMDSFFILGEFSYVDEDNMGYETVDEDGDVIYVDFTDGFHEPGYYNALFDKERWQRDQGGHSSVASASWRTTPLTRAAIPDQSSYWTGYYRLINFKTKAPQTLDCEFDIDFSGIDHRGGEIYITPKSDNVEFFLAAVFHPDQWEAAKRTIQNPDDPAELQAFLTSMVAATSYGVAMYEGPATLYPGQVINSPDPETQYSVVVIAAGDEDMTKQKMFVEHFYLPESTYSKPDMEVEAIEEKALPTELYFRVKCPTGDAALAAFAMNEARNWDIFLTKQGVSVENVIMSKGTLFEAEEMEFINSAEGFEVRFTGLRPGTKYGFGAISLNPDFYCGNGEYVEYTTPSIDSSVERIESSYFESLKGEWTLTATIDYKEYNNMDFQWYPKSEVRKSRVVIGDIVMPGLDDEDYDIANRNYYGPVSREQMDAIYEEINEALPAYHESIRGKNRILCQGYDLSPWLRDRHFSVTDYASPHDLLTDRYYPYYDPQTLFFEYGPKWFIEVLADGTLGVPFNAYEMDPAYGFEGPYYIAGINSQSITASSGNYKAIFAGVENESWTTGYFPITMPDENTIIIKPYVYNNERYFAHCVMIDANGYSVNSLITSEIVLTRGWDPKDHPEYKEETETTTLGATSQGVTPIKVDGRLATKLQIRPRGITNFDLE